MTMLSTRLHRVAACATAAVATTAVGLLMRHLRRKRRGLTSWSVQGVSNPHPEWTAGTKQPKPFSSDTMVPLDPAKLKTCYPLVISSYVPRPIALISSMSAAGVRNCAPFSYSGLVGHDPPALAVSICRKGAGGAMKDSCANVLETREFTVNLMSEWFVESANHTCGNFDADVDEFKVSGLTPVPSAKVGPPRVGESAVQFECKLVHSYDMANKDGKVTTTLLVGEVVMVHVQEELLDLEWGPGKPKVKFDKLKPMARLGGNTYGIVSRTFDLDRPDRPASGR